MNRRTRIIPTLQIENQRLIKTIKFKRPRYLGDPINAVKIFNEKGIDELSVLDIGASSGRSNIDLEYLKNIATEAFMPMSYGGGIQTLEDCKQIFKIGYEKIILGTALLENTEFVKELIKYAGSQSVVASIDYKRDLFKRNRCCINSGKIKIKKDPVALAKEVEKLGVGEIMLHSIERDGLQKGYDLNMLQAVSKATTIPIIVCGGAGSLFDLKLAIEAGADAVAAGSMFVYWGKKKAILINYPEESELIEKGIFSDEWLSNM